MAKVVEDPDSWGRPSRKRSEHRSYPWPTWTDGQWREAVQGEDFDCAAQSFMTAIYHHARSYGKTASVRVDGVKVLFRLVCTDGG